jgi:hypothetical protein
MRGLGSQLTAIDVLDVLWPPMWKAVHHLDVERLYTTYVEPELMDRPVRRGRAGSGAPRAA